MSCITKIQESMQWKNEKHKTLAKYISENKNSVVNYSVQELSDKTGISSATIVRYARKLGYDGYTDLKIDLARDKDNQNAMFDDIIRQDDSIETIEGKAYRSNLAVIEKTYQLVNNAMLKKAIDILNTCDCVYIVGIGSSGLASQDLLQKLTRINKRAIYFADFHLLLTSLTHIKKNDALIAISYSGQTKEVLSAMNIAKAAKASTIAITQFHQSMLSKTADISLYIPIQEKELRLGAMASRISTFIITDLLYLGLVQNNMVEIKESIIDTRKQILNYEEK